MASMRFSAFVGLFRFFDVVMILPLAVCLLSMSFYLGLLLGWACEFVQDEVLIIR